MPETNIEWANHTWNPIVGCEKVSSGCKYCYAERDYLRHQGRGITGYEKGFKKETVLLHDRLNEPLLRKEPTVYFVCSISDLFQDKVPFDFINEVMEVIELSPQHSFLVLTKRSERMREYFETRVVPFNAFIGVSVEDKKHGVPRIAELQKIKAKTRFLSVEPLLEDVGEINLSGIHRVIVGGESGWKARQMQESWVLNVKSQCEAASVDFFFKQWGQWGNDGVRRAKEKNGRLLQGQTWGQIHIIDV